MICNRTVNDRLLGCYLQRPESTLDSKTEGILDFEEDKAGCLGLGFSFVFPMIGIVLYFYQKESVSNPSSYLIAALLGFICGMTFNVLLSAL
mgnify:CR=1 FL=1